MIVLSPDLDVLSQWCNVYWVWRNFHQNYLKHFEVGSYYMMLWSTNPHHWNRAISNICNTYFRRRTPWSTLQIWWNPPCGHGWLPTWRLLASFQAWIVPVAKFTSGRTWMEWENENKWNHDASTSVSFRLLWQVPNEVIQLYKVKWSAILDWIICKVSVTTIPLAMHQFKLMNWDEILTNRRPCLTALKAYTPGTCEQWSTPSYTTLLICWLVGIINGGQLEGITYDPH